jgi:hypothetical protein
MDTLTSLIAIITIIVIVYMVFVKKSNAIETSCHPKTDNFDFWCLKEIGKGWFFKDFFKKGCGEEQIKATCKRN